MKKISDYLPPEEILAQLGEEASELAQAALKLRRALDGTNPTPKSVEECKTALCEEYADVIVCADALDEILTDKYFFGVYDVFKMKYNRWLTRLEEKEAEKQRASKEV